jgi:hypothetical protein
MTTAHVFRSVLLASGVLLIAACASQPPGSLIDKKFEQETRAYQKFEKDGETIYCQKQSSVASRISTGSCIRESDLRVAVENFERDRNAVQRGGPPYVSTSPGGG